MSLSRVISILGGIASALTVIGAFVETIKPGWALIIVSASQAITLFTERVQGGKSKV